MRTTTNSHDDCAAQVSCECLERDANEDDGDGVESEVDYLRQLPGPREAAVHQNGCHARRRQRTRRGMHQRQVEDQQSLSTAASQSKESKHWLVLLDDGWRHASWRTLPQRGLEEGLPSVMQMSAMTWAKGCQLKTWLAVCWESQRAARWRRSFGGSGGDRLGTTTRHPTLWRKSRLRAPFRNEWHSCDHDFSCQSSGALA